MLILQSGTSLARHLILLLVFTATALFCAPVAASASPDVTPPQLASLSYSPASVDVTSASQQVVVTAHVTGAGGVATTPGYNYVHFYDRSPTYQDSGNGFFSLVSGTPQDGVWQATVTFKQGLEPGSWVYAGSFVDGVGNSAAFDSSGANLPAGSPGPLTRQQQHG